MEKQKEEQEGKPQYQQFEWKIRRRTKATTRRTIMQKKQYPNETRTRKKSETKTKQKQGGKNQIQQKQEKQKQKQEHPNRIKWTK